MVLPPLLSSRLCKEKYICIALLNIICPDEGLAAGVDQEVS